MLEHASRAIARGNVEQTNVLKSEIYNSPDTGQKTPAARQHFHIPHLEAGDAHGKKKEEKHYPFHFE